eukprot:SAG22_NODE_22342_length_213_cov_200.201754_2_plen_35_part_01
MALPTLLYITLLLGLSALLFLLFLLRTHTAALRPR